MQAEIEVTDQHHNLAISSASVTVEDINQRESIEADSIEDSVVSLQVKNGQFNQVIDN